jgi:hypothetical protein
VKCFFDNFPKKIGYEIANEVRTLADFSCCAYRVRFADFYISYAIDECAGRGFWRDTIFPISDMYRTFFTGCITQKSGNVSFVFLGQYIYLDNSLCARNDLVRGCGHNL